MREAFATSDMFNGYLCFLDTLTLQKALLFVQQPFNRHAIKKSLLILIPSSIFECFVHYLPYKFSTVDYVHGSMSKEIVVLDTCS